MQEEDQVPLLKKWSSWYGLILAVLAIQIILFYFLTEAFR